MRYARGSRLPHPTRARAGRRGWRGLRLPCGRTAPYRVRGCLLRTRPWRADSARSVCQHRLRRTSSKDHLHGRDVLPYLAALRSSYAIHPSAWKVNSPKFAVSRPRPPRSRETGRPRGSEGHWFSRCYHQADLSGGVKGLRNQVEEFGGELYAARGVFGELHPPEQVFQRDGAPAGWEVQVSQPVDGVLGGLHLPRNVGPLQVVVEVYVADEGRCSAARLYKVEAEEARTEGRVPHVQADADRGVLDREDLLGQLGRPDRVVVDGAAHYRPLGVVVLDGDGHAELSRQISGLPQGGPLGGELILHAMPCVARCHALAGMADHHLGADALRKPEAGVEDLALQAVGAQVHEVDLERGVDRVRQLRLQQLPNRPQPVRIQATAEDDPKVLGPDLHEIRSGAL